MNMDSYELSLSIIKKNIHHSHSGSKSGPDFLDFLPLVILGALMIIILTIWTGHRISKLLEKPEIDPDSPPRYRDVLTSVDTDDAVSNRPPSYELAVQGERPPTYESTLTPSCPTYAFTNESFIPDPPAYTAVGIEPVIQTTTTIVF